MTASLRALRSSNETRCAHLVARSALVETVSRLPGFATVRPYERAARGSLERIAAAGI